MMHGIIIAYRRYFLTFSFGIVTEMYYTVKGMWIYSPPRHKCDLISFKKIAKIYFTEETYSVFTPITSYADLQPLPAARTVENILNGIGKDTPQFLKTDYYKTVKCELNMLEYILGLKKV